MQSNGQKSPRILPRALLMLGNSLTTANSMPNLLAQIANARVAVHARGGAQLAEHLNPATRLGSATQEALASGRFDYVVLQEMSHKPATNPTAYQQAVTALCAQIRAAGATPVVYATWGYAPDCSRLEKLGLSYEEMAQRMQESCEEAAVENGALLADPGRIFRQRADRALWDADGVHPSPSGSLLAAKCIAQACGFLQDEHLYESEE